MDTTALCRSRRDFLTGAALLVAGAPLSAPALAQSAPDVRWTMISVFPPSLDMIRGGAETCAAAVSEMTDKRFAIKTRPASAVASASEALDAVADGRADCAHTMLSYSWPKTPAYVFASGAPFGMNARQHAAWLKIGGGNALIDDLLAERGLMAMPLGATGGQMAGWFRKEMHGPGDLAGMKVHTDGIVSRILETRGAIVVRLPEDRIVAALGDGSLDAFDGIAPYDDEKFAGSGVPGRRPISAVAPYYYYPGCWRGQTHLHLVVSKSKFLGLPKAYQAALRAAAALADEQVRTQYDAANPESVRRLVVGGAELRLFTKEILEACFHTTKDLYAGLGQRDPKFKAIAESYAAFRSNEYLWWQLAEYSFDNFMIRQWRAASL